MKKTLIAILSGITIFTSSAMAEVGINIGISGSAGLFAATATETETGPNQTEKHKDSEHGEAAWGSIFIEKTIGDRLTVGIDYVPSSLESETTESSRLDKTTTDTQADTVNKVQVDFEDLTTVYLAFNVTENAYIKAGFAQVDVITNESLGTGSTYGNTDMDGTVLAVGYNKSFDNTMFVRVEGSYMNFDGVSVTSSNTDNKVSLNNLDGVSGKISIGKSF